MVVSRICDILCHRDNITTEEAQELIDQTIEEINANLGDPEAIEDIMGGESAYEDEDGYGDEAYPEL